MLYKLTNQANERPNRSTNNREMEEIVKRPVRE